VARSHRRESNLVESIGIKALARRLSLRSTALAREHPRAQIEKKNPSELLLEWIDALAESSSVRRTLVVVKRPFRVNEPSSLERGSAATRTVVRSISLVFGPDELTHISRINRR
jgi:hypothetical protein